MARASKRREDRRKRPGPQVSGKAGAGKPERLTGEKVLLAAVALVGREGPDALTFRRLGEELRCEAMSLYHYFPNKQRLVDAVIDRVLGEIKVPAPGNDWAGELREIAWGFRAMALKYPRLFPLMAVHRMNTSAGIALMDRIVGTLRGAGFEDAVAARLFRDFSYFIVGASLSETGPRAKSAGSEDALPDAATARRHPNLAAVTRHLKPDQREDAFKLGLELLLDGMARLKRAASGR